jgi:hypothetical protein
MRSIAERERGPRHGFAVVGRGGITKRPKPQGGFLQLSFFRRHTFEVFSEGFYVFVLGTCRREALRSFFFLTLALWHPKSMSVFVML